MNQAELQKMAEERVKDAKVLLDGGRWEFAYYTAGYAVECALKSCILARIIHNGWIFEGEARKTVDECRTHEFTRLIRIAGLVNELTARFKESARVADAFVDHWRTVQEWTVETRYQPKSELEAKKLYQAITEEPDGVLKWIQMYW